MNLLKDGIEQQAVIKTTLTRKLTIDGMTKAYPVYKVSLDWLFYNDQNDRIATWISQYKAQHNGQAPDISQREAYNDIIEEFIVASNPDAIRKTQTNIEMVDQREPGVVLADGRIIDGNRRFTCLRRLHEKNERFGYFETVILDRSIESNAKQIKILELMIQHGEESKVDYNPIDRLVGLYVDVVANQLLTVEEYAKSTNESESEVRRRVEIAKLMVEFLEFINAPQQFYIARDLQIYYPLEELLKMMKKGEATNVQRIKEAVFTNILMQPSSDMIRLIRNIKSIVGSEYQEGYLDEIQSTVNKVNKLLPPVGKMDTSVIRNVMRTNEEIAQELEKALDASLFSVKKNETRNRPVQLVEKATSFLESIDVNILLKLNDSELRRLEKQLLKLEEVISTLKHNM